MPEPSLLVRIPVVNRSREMAGYDLRMSAAAASGNEELATLLGLANDQSNLFSRVPNRFVFTDCAQGELAAPGQPHAGRLTLCIASAAPGAQVSVPQIKKWKAAGFGICLDRPYASDLSPDALDEATFVTLDCGELGTRSEKTCTQLRRHSAKQIAIGIDSLQAFESALTAGCDLFRGYHFTEVSGQQSHAISPSYATIVTLMQLTQQNAPVAKIEEALKRDATISFRLLRYINSAGFGLSCEIQSFRHAVAVLGYQNLYRWLALLMVTAARQSASALLTTAVTRGRLTELLGDGLFDQQQRDNLFIVGAFSLLDAILKAPLESIVEQIPLSETILEALFRHEGPYGPLLSIVEAAESFDQPQARAKALETADLLGITAQQLNRAQLEALVWAEAIGH